MNKYVMELIGTFFLVLTIGLTVIGNGSGVIPPLAIGSVLMVMVYAGGHISGAHYNPMVTLALWIRGRCASKDVIPYWIAQIIAAAAAASIIKILKAGIEIKAMNLDPGPALIAEFIFSFALAFIVLSTATVKSTAGNSYYGLAIGFVVLAGAFSVGNISGGVFNPAVATGITAMGLVHWGSFWIYLVSNFLGGAVAAVVFKSLNPEDK
ncbi:MAG: aquaporin [Terriglobia bacterium]